MNTLFPLLRNNARVVNVSSDWGCIHYIDNEHFKNKYVNTPDFDKFKTGHIIIQSVLETYKNNLNNKETLKQIMIILLQIH